MKTDHKELVTRLQQYDLEKKSRGVLNFYFGISVWTEGPKIEALENGLPLNLGSYRTFLVQFEVLGTEI